MSAPELYYWYRPSVHFCESPSPERTVCGAEVTGHKPTISPVPEGADPATLFDDREANVCGNCLRSLESRGE